MNTRLNIEKLDGNIVQKHGGSKQVWFKQLGPGVETGVHGVHDEKRVWFEVELQGAQGDREAEVFQVSNDDTAVAQRRLEDKQPEEKTNTDYLVKEQEKEYQTGWKIKTGNVLDSCNQSMSKVLWAEDTTMSTYLVTTSPSSAIGFKMLIDMLGFFGWLASIMQGMLELVKVKCIFMRYRTGSMQVLQRDEFEVELQDGHTFEVKPHGNVNHVVGSQKVQTQDLIYYHLARDREQHSSVPQEVVDTHELKSITLDFKRECQHDDIVDSLTSPVYSASE
ncbi:zinc finger, CCHC-type containing protein [Tanacetum coccineum]